MTVIKTSLTFLVLAIWLGQAVVFAQQQQAPQPANIQDILDPQFQNSSLLYKNSNPNDNPFLVNDFMTADIYMKNNKVIKAVQVKYDIEHQWLFANDNGRFLILNTPAIDHFDVMLPNAEQQSKFISIRNGDKDDFFEVLAGTDIRFLKKTSKARQRRSEANSTGYNDEGPRPSAYKVSETYFLLMADGLHEVRLNKKSILSTLGSSYRSCAAKNELKQNQVNDIITLLRECR
jgi:hypothetical protein